MNDASPTPSLRAHSYAGSLTVIAVLAASITALALILLSNGDAISLRPAPLGQNPAGVAPPWLAALVVAALAAAALSAACAGFTIRAIRLMTYQRAVRVYCQHELARAGLNRPRALLTLSVANERPSANTPANTSANIRAHHGTTATTSAVRRLTSMRRALLLGASGSGKTTLLTLIAHQSAAPLATIGVILGYRRLPALISLSGLATSMGRGETAETYLATQFARIGSNGLAARTERMLRRGALSMLCDDYDALDEVGREQVHQALSRWSSPPFDRCQLIIAHDSERFDTDSSNRGPRDSVLNSLPITRLQPLSARALARLLRQANTAKPGAKVSEPAGDALDRASATLRAMLRVPAIAHAYIVVSERDGSAPAGYSALLRRVLLIARAGDEASGAPDPGDAQGERDVALVWGALAASLQATGRATLPLDAARTMGECAAAWLNGHPPLMPVSFALQDDIAFDAGTLETGIKAGITAGVLHRQTDGGALGFSFALLRRAAVAYWLDALDNGLGRLNSTLLTPAWVAPVALWASARTEASDVPQRIYRLTQSPDSVASRAGLARGSDVAPVALALALVAVIEATEPALIAPSRGDPELYRRRFAAQQRLRDQLDSTAIMAADGARRPALAQALRLAHSRSGLATDAGVRALINLDSHDSRDSLDRLVRAQLILALGLLATPEAIEELIQQVSHTDHTIRQAARQALAYAGPDAIAVAQRLAASPDPETRARASEALASITTALPQAPAVAGAVALSGLRSADALQRRAAVTTLGALRASSALDALVARLDDTSLDVQIAAVIALGQLGAPAGLAALRKRASAPHPSLRRAIAGALGATAELQSVPILLELLRDKDPAVRAAAATALGAQGDPRAAGPLRNATDDANGQVSRAARAAARRLTGG